MSLDHSTQALIELDGKLQRMMDGIDIVKERQMEMADDVAKIKEAVYNPDQGIYARIRELEAFKKQASRLIWIIVTTLIGLGIHQVLTTV